MESFASLTASLPLHRLSDTRCSARIDAVKPPVKRPREILHSLSTVKMELDLMLICVVKLIHWLIGCSHLNLLY